VVVGGECFGELDSSCIFRSGRGNTIWHNAYKMILYRL
jgi:hypothetical protein